MSQGSVLHFAKFLTDLKEATNESQKRHLFTNLAAVGFNGSDFATELALTAEYRVRFQQKGLLRRGAVDSFYSNLVIEFENDLGRTLDHALEQLQGYVAGAWREDGSTDRQYLAVATDGATWRVYLPTLEHPEDPIEAENVRLTLSEAWPTVDDDAPSLRDFLNRLFFRKTLLHPTAANFARDFGVSGPAFLGASGELWQKRGELRTTRSSRFFGMRGPTPYRSHTAAWRRGKTSSSGTHISRLMLADKQSAAPRIRCAMSGPDATAPLVYRPACASEQNPTYLEQ